MPCHVDLADRLSDLLIAPAGLARVRYKDRKTHLRPLPRLNSFLDPLELSVEQSFEKLESMVRMLESEDVTLEDSFRIYQDGMNLLKAVNEKLDLYEKKMLVLGEDGVVEEFE